MNQHSPLKLFYLLWASVKAPDFEVDDNGNYKNMGIIHWNKINLNYTRTGMISPITLPELLTFEKLVNDVDSYQLLLSAISPTYVEI